MELKYTVIESSPSLNKTKQRIADFIKTYKFKQKDQYKSALSNITVYKAGLDDKDEINNELTDIGYGYQTFYGTEIDTVLGISKKIKVKSIYGFMDDNQTYKVEFSKDTKSIYLIIEEKK